MLLTGWSPATEIISFVEGKWFIHKAGKHEETESPSSKPVSWRRKLGVLEEKWSRLVGSMEKGHWREGTVERQCNWASWLFLNMCSEHDGSSIPQNGVLIFLDHKVTQWTLLARALLKCLYSQPVWTTQKQTVSSQKKDLDNLYHGWCVRNVVESKANRRVVLSSRSSKLYN